MRTLLCQLLDLLPSLPVWVSEQYRESYVKGFESVQILPFIVVQDLLNKTFELFGKVYLVLDGIDEVKDRAELLVYLTSLGRRGVNDKVKVLITSRTEPDIRQALQSFIKFTIHPSNTKEDIRNYIVRSVRARLELKGIHAQATVKTLHKRARGMFIWFRLVIDMLREAATPDEFQEILTTVPQELHDIYCLVLERIHKKISNGPLRKQDRAKAMFRWLTLSYRPIKIQELQEALAVEGCISSAGKADRKASWLENMSSFRPIEQAIMDVCGSLVDEDNGVISLLHHTAREFLLGSTGFRSPEVQKYTIYTNTGNASITEYCLTYLIETESGLQSSIFFDDDAEQRVELRERIISEYPFYEYACRQ